MKKIVCISCVMILVGMILFSHGTVLAVEFDFQPRLESGVMDYTFESEVANEFILSSVQQAGNLGGNFTQNSFSHSDYMSFIGFGGTFFLNRFYIDANGQYASGGQDRSQLIYSAYVPYRYDSENTYMETVYSKYDIIDDVEFDRWDKALSLGYAFTRKFSLFAGYKWADTRFKSTFQGVFDMIVHQYDGKRYVGGLYWGEGAYDFEYQGPFLGAVQGWDFNKGRFLDGVLTASLALARLSGKVTLKNRNCFVKVTNVDGMSSTGTTATYIEEGLYSRLNTKGDTLGWSCGLSWRGLTRVEGLSYFLGVSGYRYEFETQNSTQSDINETAVVYKLGLSYVF